MARKYDATRRGEAAKRTREAIVDAAFKLHGLGIIDYEALAAEANVSLPTIRKYFPTREALYENCTAWGMRYAAMPDLDLLAATNDARDRLRLAVRETFAFYESLFGQLWATYLYQAGSPVLTRLLGQIEELQKRIVDLVLAAWMPVGASAEEARGLLTGLISFLTYRALRHEGGLSPEQATERIAEALLTSLEAIPRPGGKEAANA